MLQSFATIVLAGVLVLSGFGAAAHARSQPAPLHPAPTAAQLAWHDMEMYAFVHFSINTFTGREWGYGDESPALFNPSEFDAADLVRTLADAGFRGVVLTCKHHDGFCLWPTKTTRHSIALSPYKNGKGDIVQEISHACREQGVKFGIYLSPWDRHSSVYGTPAYIKLYRRQLEELATNYGPLFLAWFDGANGGDGFYGGAKERRSIDRSKYYQWPETWSKLKQLQPRAVIFSDVGPDVRWVGNESGRAGYPCWATYTPRALEAGKAPAPGTVHYEDGVGGTAEGKYWIPAEVDVSIRPGWFWHENENAHVRTPENLLELYFNSVGRGANLNLNVPPDRRGRIHEADRRSLSGFRALLHSLYAHNYAEGATVTASSSWADCPAGDVLDRSRTTFWAAGQNDAQPQLTLALPRPASFDVIRLAEPIQLGQRIRRFRVEVLENGQFVTWISGSSIGARVLLRGRPVTTEAVRVVLEESRATPALSEVSLWRYPQLLRAPDIACDESGRIALRAPEGATVRYTVDGSEPSAQSPVYTGPFSLPKGGMVKAICEKGNNRSSLAAKLVAASTRGWKASTSVQSGIPLERAFDGNPATWWHTHAAAGELPPPVSVDIDMGHLATVASVLYTPRTDSPGGVIDQYAVYLSTDGQNWGNPVAEGEFSNMRANPVTRRIDLTAPVAARYLRFTAKRVLEGRHVTIAELGVLEQ